LLSTADSIPFGVAVSLQTGIPLVYSQGTHQPPIHDLVGAYDLAHPTTLVTNILDNPTPLIHLAHNAKRVGLDVQRTIAILDLQTTPPTQELQTISSLHLSEIANELANTGDIPEQHAKAVNEWILHERSQHSQHSEATPHPPESKLP